MIKHIATQKKLKNEHISVTFFSFKCNLGLDDDNDTTVHFEEVHGVVGGPTRLTRLQEVSVNEHLPFEIKKLGDIENYGDDKRLEIIRGLYIHCQSRAVISKTNDKSEAFLREARSKEFMSELDKACPALFFSRV